MSCIRSWFILYNSQLQINTEKISNFRLEKKCICFSTYYLGELSKGGGPTLVR